MGQDNIIHFNALRGRIRGNGILQCRLFDFDDTQSVNFPPITMESSTGRFVLKLINFKSQRACLEGKTTEIDETFRINKLVVFAKPIFTEYPA